MSTEEYDGPLDPSLLAAVEALPDAIEPSQDLWGGIEAQLDHTEERPQPAQRPWSALAVAAGISLILFGGWTMREPASPTAAPMADAPTTTADPGAKWGAEMQQANESLQHQLEARDDLSPEARSTIEKNLKTIDRAIRDVQRALDANPGDPALRRWLTNTRALKQQVLVSALHLPEGA